MSELSGLVRTPDLVGVAPFAPLTGQLRGEAGWRDQVIHTNPADKGVAAITDVVLAGGELTVQCSLICMRLQKPDFVSRSPR